MSENKLEYWTPDPATVLRLYTEMEKGERVRETQSGPPAILFLMA